MQVHNGCLGTPRMKRQPTKRTTWHMHRVLAVTGRSFPAGSAASQDLRLAVSQRVITDKSLPSLRAFEVLRINVRSLFGRDAVTAVWAGSVYTGVSEP